MLRERHVNYPKLYAEQIKELARQGMDHQLIIETYQVVMRAEDVKLILNEKISISE